MAAAAPFVPTYVKTGFGSTPLGTQSNQTIELVQQTSSRPLTFQRQATNFDAPVMLQNKSASIERVVAAGVTLQDKEGNEWKAKAQFVTSDGGCSVTLSPSALSIQLIRLTPARESKVSLLPASGLLQLVVGSEPYDCQVKSTPKGFHIELQEVRIPNSSSAMGVIFVGPLVVTLTVVAITIWNLRRVGVSPFDRMGLVNWDFGKSWAANVTLGSAFLVTLLGLTVFPERPLMMTKQSYSLLQISFAALVTAAPLVYNLITRQVEVSTGVASRIDVQGYVIMFLVSAGLVLWAALGQIATLAVLVEEFVAGSILDSLTGRTLQGVTGLLEIILLVYGFRSLYRTPRTVSAKPAAAGSAWPGPRPAIAAWLQPPISEWPIP